MKKLFRIIGLILAAILMVGFGLCGVVGITLGTNNASDRSIFILLGLPGCLISAALGFAIYKLCRAFFVTKPTDKS